MSPVRSLILRLLLWIAGPLPDRPRHPLALYTAIRPLEPARRSALWPAVRREHLRQKPVCELCGNRDPEDIEVHHVEPFHTHPERELDPTNLVTLCERSPVLQQLNCHLWAGHLGAWRAINPRVRAFIAKLAPLIRRGL